MKRSTLSVLLILFIAYISVYCQEDETPEKKPKFGLFSHYGLNIHTSDFSELSDIPNCCNDNMSGSGSGFSFGAFYEYPIEDLWGLNLRLGITDLGGLLTQEQNFRAMVYDPALDDFKGVDGIFEYRLQSSLSALVAQPYGYYQIEDNLFVLGGFDIGIYTNQEYDYIEKILEPNYGYFDENNRSRTRNAQKGNFTDASGLYFALSLGAQYQLRMNQDSSLFLAPEIFYSYLLTPIVPNSGWNVHCIKFGVSVKYMEPPPPPPPPPPPEPPTEAPFPRYPKPVKPSEILVKVTAGQIDSSNTVSGDIDIKIEDFVTHFMSPLLNYIFFDENSAQIPERYEKLKSDETDEFHVSDLQKLSGLETYYHILNITGLRLKNDTNATVTLLGTNADIGDEKGNKELSENRAKTVKDYLVYVWGIDPKRIETIAMNLPKQPSAKNDPSGQEENRRVEIISDNIKIIEPVIVEDTTRTVAKTKIRFYNNVKSITAIKSWKLSIRQNGYILKEYSGKGDVPKSIDWEISSDGKDAPKKGGFVSYGMLIEDEFGQIERSPEKQLPVEQMTVQRKKIEKKYDREYEYYSLILFDFGKYTLRKEHRKVLDYIKNRLTPESKVIITGHTDIIGSEAFNKKISTKRAEAVAKILNIPNAEIIGEGQDNLLYNNTLPEGRFYCRTVRINIETTIINQ